MMKHEDERAIDDLFDRLRNFESHSGPRDTDAERLIHQRLNENPASAYLMAQTTIVQEAALREAQQRIEAHEAKQGHGGFLGGIFGNDRLEQSAPRSGPWDRNPDHGDDRQRRPSTGGRFLAGAAQTAMGVTGGILLGSLLTGMFTGGANAVESEAPVEPEDPGVDDTGGDFGDFDIGGDF